MTKSKQIIGQKMTKSKQIIQKLLSSDQHKRGGCNPSAWIEKLIEEQ